MKRNAQIENILLKLHNIGGCDAKDDYDKGWDRAITSAIEIVEEETGVKLDSLLERS